MISYLYLQGLYSTKLPWTLITNRVKILWASGHILPNWTTHKLDLLCVCVCVCVCVYIYIYIYITKETILNICYLINIELTAIRWGEPHPPQPVASADLFTFGFPDSSVGKKSACNAGDPNWNPGSGRSTGEGIYKNIVAWWFLTLKFILENFRSLKSKIEAR